MEMTPGEIALQYKRAANKKAQLQILSELNLCSRTEIKEILIQQGIPEGEIPKIKSSREELEQVAPVQPKEIKLNKKIRVPNMVKEMVSIKMIELSEEIEEKSRQLRELDEYLKSVL